MKDLTKIELDIISNALTAYANEFHKSVEEIEKDGANCLFSGTYGDLLCRDIRLKLDLDLNPKQNNSTLLFIEKEF